MLKPSFFRVALILVLLGDKQVARAAPVVEAKPESVRESLHGEEPILDHSERY